MKASPSILKLIIPAIALILFLSCCRKNVHQLSDDQLPEDKRVTSLVSPKANTIIVSGDSVNIGLIKTDTSVTIDSFSVTAGKIPGKTFYGNLSGNYWHSGGSRLGQVTLKIMVYYADSLQESHHVNLVILSDIIPTNYTYKVINKFPHDDKAYTQGLFYNEGFLYESTGLEGKSSVRIVNIETGRQEKIINLAPQYFGEGIALFKDQVYQVTYRSQVGFVYSKKDLSLIRSFDYQILEGWGLTTDGENLIMTDGSAQLFFIEPEFFTQVDKIEVFDNKGMVDSLNEVEFIKGKILANVYGQTYIVIIHPETGKVVGKIELSNLMPEGSQGDYGKVLNGIAYNPGNGHLYVTGKNWPVLYEIELVPAL